MNIPWHGYMLMLPCKPYCFLKRQNENSSHDFFLFNFPGLTPLTKGEKVYFSCKILSKFQFTSTKQICKALDQMRAYLF